MTVQRCKENCSDVDRTNNNKCYCWIYWDFARQDQRFESEISMNTKSSSAINKKIKMVRKMLFAIKSHWKNYTLNLILRLIHTHKFIYLTKQGHSWIFFPNSLPLTMDLFTLDLMVNTFSCTICLRAFNFECCGKCQSLYYWRTIRQTM